MMKSRNSFKTLSSFKWGDREVDFYSLESLERSGIGSVRRLPFSLRILLENMLRREDGVAVRESDILSLVRWDPKADPSDEIQFTPARVILQDFTGVPAVVDLAAMRQAMAAMGGDPNRINPLVPSELVIDHSVQVDSFGTRTALQINLGLEFERNKERYEFLRWGQGAFTNFKVVPPGTGIVHQVNLEYLARVVFCEAQDGRLLAYPDTLVGTDSHTTMINGLGVLGWGVGGIEAEAAMLGQPISLLVPHVVGFRVTGSLKEGRTATDLVLTITEILRKKGVVGKFVEFFGPGLSSLSLADRATIGNMSPEYGATCAIFPIDGQTLDYLRFTGRDEDQVQLVESYMKAQGLFSSGEDEPCEYSDLVELDLSEVEPSLAGPRRPQDRISLGASKVVFEKMLSQTTAPSEVGGGTATKKFVRVQMTDEQTGEPLDFELHDGSVVIAAITSCTNTSNPSVMVAAGLLARKAWKRGLTRKPWVKTSLAPGSQVVSEYLDAAGLTPDLDRLGFNLVGYGCTTCIGNSGPLPEPIARSVEQSKLLVCAILSGNRNFEGRINPHVRANYLASPPLVVAYALAGKMDIDLTKEPIGYDPEGKPVFLADVWPSQQEIQETMKTSVRREMFERRYADVFTGDANWRGLPSPTGELYAWDEKSTYIKHPPFFEGITESPEPIGDVTGMRVLAVLGDSVTTDHISPAGSIPRNSPTGRYLMDRGVDARDFNSFGARRGNHEVMVRGTFGNIRLRNLLVPDTEGGFSRMADSPEPGFIYDVAMKYQADGVPLMILAGKEYGSGSSRDWAAKGTCLLGVRVVLAESYERIHRSNLIGMGVLPLQFEAGETRESLGLTGLETYDVLGLDKGLEPGQKLRVRVVDGQGQERNFTATVRVDTPNEVLYYKHGGILHYVLRSLRDQN